MPFPLTFRGTLPIPWTDPKTANHLQERYRATLERFGTLKVSVEGGSRVLWRGSVPYARTRLRLLGVNAGSIRFQDPTPVTASYELRFHRTFIWTGVVAAALATVGLLGALAGRGQVLKPAALFAGTWLLLFSVNYLLGTSDFPSFLEEALGDPPSGGESRGQAAPRSSPT